MSAQPAPVVDDVPLAPRDCEACGSDELRPLWRREGVIAGVSTRRRFDAHVAVCERCALVQASPAPPQQELDRHYADARPVFAGQELDFAIEKRVELLERYAGPAATFAEVGGKDVGPFFDAAAALFGNAFSAEPGEHAGSEWKTAADLPDASVDVLAHYFVLEHVRDTAGFLGNCRRALRDDGVMVCEVPDLELYPTDPAGLFLVEHMNHFSAASLARLCARHGLVLEEADRDGCSRSFGFVATFRAAEPGAEPPRAEPGEVEHAAECVLAGAAAVARFDAVVEGARRRVEAVGAAGGQVVVWGANDNLLALLGDGALELPAEVVVVDSDPSKSGFLPNRAVDSPDAARDALARAELLVLCTRRHAGQIAAEAARLAGRAIPEERVLVVDV